MKRLHQLIAAAFLAAAFCESAPAKSTTVFLPEPPRHVLRPAAVGDYSSIRTIAIVSLLGPELHMRNPRSIFGVKTSTLDIRDWQLNEWNVHALHHFLGARFIVKDLPPGATDSIDPAALAEDLNVDILARGAVYRRYVESIPHEGIDALVVIRPMPGFKSGLMLQSPWGGPPTYFASFIVDILDLRHFLVLGSAPSRLQDAPGDNPTVAIDILDGSYAMDSSFTLPPEKREKIKAAFTSLVRRSLIETLRSLKMGVVLPPPGDPSILDLPIEDKP